MSILSGQSKGFTLIEVLIALAITAVIMTGLYSAFDGIINTKERLNSKNDNIFLTQAVQRIMSRDIRMMSSQVASEKPGVESLMSFISQNSLTFNKTISVTVRYYIDNNVLYREEVQEDMGYIMPLPLITGVTEAKVYTFNGTEYKEGYKNNGFIFQIDITTDNKTINFITGRVTNATFE